MALKKDIALSTLNQVISSAGSLILTSYLMMTLSVGDFGYYNLGQILTLTIAGCGASVFITQYIVNFNKAEYLLNLDTAGRTLKYTLISAIIVFFISLFVLIIVVKIGYMVR